MSCCLLHFQSTTVVLFLWRNLSWILILETLLLILIFLKTASYKITQRFSLEQCSGNLFIHLYLIIHKTKWQRRSVLSGCVTHNTAIVHLFQSRLPTMFLSPLFSLFPSISYLFISFSFMSALPAPGSDFIFHGHFPSENPLGNPTSFLSFCLN